MIMILFDMVLTFVSLVSMIGFLDVILKLSNLLGEKHETSVK